MNEETKKKLLEHFKTGAALARFVDREPPMATYWLSGQRTIPATLARAISNETKIPFYELRPDLK